MTIEARTPLPTKIPVDFCKVDDLHMSQVLGFFKNLTFGDNRCLHLSIAGKWLLHHINDNGAGMTIVMTDHDFREKSVVGAENFADVLDALAFLLYGDDEVALQDYVYRLADEVRLSVSEV